MMFSTSSPTYPASVSVVASAITNGTSSSRAIVFLDAGVEPLVMVVDRNRQDLLGKILPDHVLIENLPDLVRGRELVLVGARRVRGGPLLADDVVAELDALVADEHRRTGDKLPHLVLALAAEGAVKKLVAGRFIGHSPALDTLEADG